MNRKTLNVCTWNLCLGLQYKLNYVREMLIKEEIDILCLQEAELESDFDCKNLKINGYELEIDIGINIIRTVVYIKTTLNYERLENRGFNQNLIVLKSMQRNAQPLFISAIYKTWKNVGGMSQEDAFSDQVEEIERLIPRNNECIVMGDFNIDFAKRNNQNVVNRSLNQLLRILVENHSMEQVVSFHTWSRTVNVLQ